MYTIYVTDISCIHAFTVKIHAKPVTEINPSGLIYVTGLACIFIQQLTQPTQMHILNTFWLGVVVV